LKAGGTSEEEEEHEEEKDFKKKEFYTSRLGGVGRGVAASSKPVRTSVKPMDFACSTRKASRKGSSFDP